MATIPLCFLLMKSDVSRPDRTTSEPCEHTFGYARSIIREFLVEISYRYKLSTKNDFQTSCDRKKGYGSIESIVAEVSNKGGPVSVNTEEDDKSNVDILWKDLRVIINECNSIVTTFLSNVLGVEFYPITKQFQTAENISDADLLDDLINKMQKKDDHIFFPKKKGIDNARSM